MTKLFFNIKELVNVRTDNTILRGKKLSDLPVINNAFLLIEDDIISMFGSMSDIEWMVPNRPADAEDLSGKFVLPSWCDSHTHIVYAGTRESEFVDKINGLSYAEIAAKGGGILNSSKKLKDASESELFNQAWSRLKELQKMGTGAIEIKSGYGLSLEAELKMLRVIKRLKERSGMIIKSTFLGAHTFPAEFKEDHDGYIDLIINEMLPAVANEKLADYVDVFCETGFFSPGQTDKICKAAAGFGLRPKLHVNQLNSIGGIEVGIANEAISLDHLETLTPHEIDLLGSWKGICTLLPTPAFFLRMNFQPARKLIEAGAAIALASDYNPGSSPSGNMNFVASLSCIQMRMLPEEVINAGTINGAYAIQSEKNVGSIMVGKKANIIITKEISSLASLPYNFGNNLIEKVMLNGEFV